MQALKTHFEQIPVEIVKKVATEFPRDEVTGNMQEKRERWLELAELAANEQDPEKLIKLVHEINELLEKKQERLSRLRAVPKIPES